MPALPTAATDASPAWLGWAVAAGSHPGWSYALGAALAAALAWGLSRAHLPGAHPGPQVSAQVPQPDGQAQRRATWTLIGRLLFALGLLLASGWLVGEVGEHLTRQAHDGRPGAIGAWDDAFTAAMAPQRTAPLLAAAALVSHAGDPLVVATLGVLVALALWRARHRLLATAWSMALIGNGVLTVLFKGWWARLRPEHQEGLTLVSGYSFPSGHASASAACYLWLACLAAWLLPRRWRLAGALVACLTGWSVAFSRLVLNVHFASDVAAGLLVGSTCAAASLLAVHSLMRWRQTLPRAQFRPTLSHGT